MARDKSRMSKGLRTIIALKEKEKEFGEFSWWQAVFAYGEEFGPHHWEDTSSARAPSSPLYQYMNEKRYLHMTVGNLLRGQLKAGTIRRIRKGYYMFTGKPIGFPLFCEAGFYSGKYSGGRHDGKKAPLPTPGPYFKL